MVADARLRLYPACEQNVRRLQGDFLESQLAVEYQLPDFFGVGIGVIIGTDFSSTEATGYTADRAELETLSKERGFYRIGLRLLEDGSPSARIVDLNSGNTSVSSGAQAGQHDVLVPFDGPPILTCAGHLAVFENTNQPIPYPQLLREGMAETIDDTRVESLIILIGTLSIAQTDTFGFEKLTS